MPKKRIYKEYTGTGASGGNAGDGNNIVSPRPFADDEDEMENYTTKNVYGGEGEQYTGDKASYGNKNRMSFGINNAGMFEEIEEYINADDYGDATLTTQGQMRSRFTKTGRPPGIQETISFFKEEIQKLLVIKEQGGAEDEAYQRKLKSLQKAVIQFQINYLNKKKNQQRAQQAKAVSDASKGFDEQIAALRDQLSAIDNPPEKGEQNESIMENYFKDKNSNLMERMDFYRKEAKSHILMEGTLKKMFEKFKKGESNEDIMKEYASRGIKIPETFMSKIRKQYEEMKKLQLEIEFSEQETTDMFKVPAITTFDQQEVPKEEKTLASGIFKEEILKNQIIKEIEKLKNK